MPTARTLIGVCLAAALLVACRSAPTAPAPTHGALVIVGGGGTTAPILARALELARGSASRVVVLPQASEREDRGEDAARMWREAGAAEVVNLDDLTDLEQARRELERADLIWFGGGDQSRLVADLRAAGLVELLHARHAAGATLGGTSAGAAVMSPLMLTGEGPEALVSLVPGSTELVEGLGFLPRTIVDQHFVKRQRATRLLGALLEHPDHVGIGIDERTALVVVNGRAEVLGEGPVLVFDARRASVEPFREQQPSAARGLALHVLRSGMGHELPR